MLARYYSAQLGRFMSFDPLGYQQMKGEERANFLKSPQAWNRYSYVVNNPLRYTDPDGLKCRNEEAKKQLDETRKNGTKEQKEDMEAVETDPRDVDVDLSPAAAFVEEDAQGNEKGTEKFNTGNAKDKKDADAKNEEAKKNPNISPRTGEHNGNPDGSITVTVYLGTRQYSGQDQGRSRGNYIMTVVAHEAGEIVGRSHEEALQREGPP